MDLQHDDPASRIHVFADGTVDLKRLITMLKHFSVTKTWKAAVMI